MVRREGTRVLGYRGCRKGGSVRRDEGDVGYAAIKQVYKTECAQSTSRAEPLTA